MKAGSATVTVTTSEGKFTVACKVTVTNVPVTGVALDRGDASLDAGETLALTAAIVPSNATNKGVTWSSSDAAVATVSATGVVTGVNTGAAAITVKTADGAKTAICTVTVR